MPVPVMSPAHFFGLEAVHFVVAGDRGMGVFIRARQLSAFRKRLRRQRRGPRARGKRAGAGGQSNGKFQKMSAFHDKSLFVPGQ